MQNLKGKFTVKIMIINVRIKMYNKSWKVLWNCYDKLDMDCSYLKTKKFFYKYDNILHKELH